MRIIAGRARSLPLKSVPGIHTRPTTDRTKETLFNILHPYLMDCRFLDLFAGSGGIGLEAVSRGAKEAVFVEQNRKAAACIRENICFTKAEAESRLLCMDVFAALGLLEREGKRFGLIFMDPPYGQMLERQVLEYLKDSSLPAEDALFAVEASLETDFSYLEDWGYEVWKQKKYKTNVHMLIQKKA